jgi:hypothetical protein
MPFGRFVCRFVSRGSTERFNFINDAPRRYYALFSLIPNANDHYSLFFLFHTLRSFVVTLSFDEFKFVKNVGRLDEDMKMYNIIYAVCMIIIKYIK